MQNSNLIFDFDETIAYRDGKWSLTLLELLQNNGYFHIDINDIRIDIKKVFPWNHYQIPHNKLLKNLSWWEFFQNKVVQILVKNGLDIKEAERLSKLVRENYIDIKKWNLFEDSIQVLNYLSNLGYNIYLLSNHVPELEDLVSGLNISHFFKKVYNSAKIGYEKPNSKIFRYIIKDLKEKSTNIIMIGDNYISDIVGARSNCMNAILVRSENLYKYQYYSKDLLGVISLIENNFFDI